MSFARMLQAVDLHAPGSEEAWHRTSSFDIFPNNFASALLNSDDVIRRQARNLLLIC